MAAELFRLNRVSTTALSRNIPVVLDPEVDFDEQLEEYRVLGMIHPSRIRDGIVRFLPCPSWDNASIEIPIDATRDDRTELIILTNPRGFEVELYQPDETGLLQPVNLRDLPKVIHLRDPKDRFALAARKKGDSYIQLLNSTRHFPPLID